MTRFLKDPKNILILFLSLLCLILIWPGNESSNNPVEPEGEKAQTIWTCSMHPQIQLPKPVPCPICGMELIPLDEGGEQDGPWQLSLSEHAIALSGVESGLIQRQAIDYQLRLVGKVNYDEKRIREITAWVPGRIDRLFVDFTGIRVMKGYHMVDLYSPELITAQQELRQALRAVQKGQGQASQSRLKAARRKLSLFGLSESQIAILEKQSGPADYLTLEAPMNGIVIQKHVKEGTYVKTGTPIYTVADLSRVWVVLEAYETDLSWLRYGQSVAFEVEAYPGEIFEGKIAFIDPTLDPKTRTVKVRVEMANPDGRLKPDMFVRATVKAALNQSGTAMDPNLVGKWVCPMHPEVTAEHATECNVCGMDLVRAESLGLQAEGSSELPLVVPASATLITGERAVVYVDLGQGKYEGREVVLGPRAGDFFLVKKGLEEGEKVVTQGAFKIDSELQIRAKHSMMYHPDLPEEQPEMEFFETSMAFRNGLGPIYESYFEIQTQLSLDTLHSAHEAASKLAAHLKKPDPENLEGKAAKVWQSELEKMQAALAEFTAKDIEGARSAFEDISEGIYRIGLQFGGPESTSMLRFFCPMAFDNRGAHWLQNHGETANPYFGSRMFRCGTQVSDVKHEREQGQGGQNE